MGPVALLKPPNKVLSDHCRHTTQVPHDGRGDRRAKTYVGVLDAANTTGALGVRRQPTAGLRAALPTSY